MTVPEFFLICAPVIEKVKCSHTWLTLPKNLKGSTNISFFPLQGMIINDSIAVVNSTDSASGLVKGSVILHINGKPYSQIVEELKTLVSSEGFNTTGKIGALNGTLHVYIAIYFGFPDMYEVVYLNPDTKIVNTTVVNSTKINSFQYSTPITKRNCSSQLCFE